MVTFERKSNKDDSTETLIVHFGEGRIDSINVDGIFAPVNYEIKKTLEEIGPSIPLFLLLDLSQREYMSSAGLRASILADKKVGMHNMAIEGRPDLQHLLSFTDTAGSGRVREVIVLAGLDTILGLHNTYKEALAARKRE